MLIKIITVTRRVYGCITKNISKWARKLGFSAQFRPFLNSKIKTLTYLMHYLALHHWWKFQTNLSTSEGVRSKNTTKSSLKSYFLLLQKHLKFGNSGTTNLIWMKLTWYKYHLNTFHLVQTEAVNRRAGGGAFKKPPNQAMILSKTWIYYHLKTVYKIL